MNFDNLMPNTVIVSCDKDVPFLWELFRDFIIPSVFPIATFFLGFNISDRNENRKFKEQLDATKIDLICELEYIVEDSRKIRESLLLFGREERKESCDHNQLKLLDVDISDLKKISKNHLTRILCQLNGQSGKFNRKRISTLYKAIRKFETSISSAYKTHSEFNSDLEKTITEYNAKLTKLFSEINQISKDGFINYYGGKILAITSQWESCPGNTNPFVIEKILILPLMEISQSSSILAMSLVKLYEICFSILESINKIREVKKFHTKSYRNYAQNFKLVIKDIEPLLYELNK